MTAAPIPYLTFEDATVAIAFYVAAFNAVEEMRVVGDDGRIGHASVAIAGHSVYLADEYPELGVRSPTSFGGSPVAIVLEVPDIDAYFAKSVAAGAEGLTEPADQEHGSRHATILDPFGYRWMLSQKLEEVDAETYAERMEGSGYSVQPSRPKGAIWAALNLVDALAGIRLVVDVFGFEETLVVPGGSPDEVIHSQLTWPEGGVLQAASANRAGNVFSQQPTGAVNLYVITADPAAVHARCVEAGVEIVSPLVTPDHDPGGSVFSVRDVEGNLFSFGTYGGES